MPRWKRNVIMAVAILLAVALDQWTKQIAIEHLKGYPTLYYWGDLFRLQYSENPGGFLSLGAGLSDQVRFLLLTVLVGVFLCGLTLYVFVQKQLDRYNTTALTFVLCGGISNMIDRVFNEGGRVVDFMNMGIGNLRTGIFNIADVFIMIGMGILVFLIFKDPQKKKKQSH